MQEVEAQAKTLEWAKARVSGDQLREEGLMFELRPHYRQQPFGPPALFRNDPGGTFTRQGGLFADISVQLAGIVAYIRDAGLESDLAEAEISDAEILQRVTDALDDPAYFAGDGMPTGLLAAGIDAEKLADIEPIAVHVQRELVDRLSPAGYLADERFWNEVVSRDIPAHLAEVGSNAAHGRQSAEAFWGPAAESIDASKVDEANNARAAILAKAFTRHGSVATYELLGIDDEGLDLADRIVVNAAIAGLSVEVESLHQYLDAASRLDGDDDLPSHAAPRSFGRGIATIVDPTTYDRSLTAGLEDERGAAYILGQLDYVDVDEEQGIIRLISNVAGRARDLREQLAVDHQLEPREGIDALPSPKAVAAERLEQAEAVRAAVLAPNHLTDGTEVESTLRPAPPETGIEELRATQHWDTDAAGGFEPPAGSGFSDFTPM